LVEGARSEYRLYDTKQSTSLFLNDIMMRRSFILSSIAMLTGCFAGGIHAAGAADPDISVTYTSVIRGRSIHMKSAKLPGDKEWSDGLFVCDNPKEWRSNGMSPGVSSDSQGLPEWVDFEWQEWPHPYPKVPSRIFHAKEDPAMERAIQQWRDQFDSDSKQIPIKTQRVQVRGRIPLDVVQEVMESQRIAPRGKLPGKLMDVYFVWTVHGVKLYWELRDPAMSRPLKSGGDDIDSM